MQEHLSIRVLSNDVKAKKLSHNVFLYDEETQATETFQIDSPSPILPPQGVPKRASSSASSSAATPSISSSNSPSSSSTLGSATLGDDSFLQEIAELGEDFELLAAIPAVHTPRVVAAPGKNSPQLARAVGNEAVVDPAEPEGQ